MDSERWVAAVDGLLAVDGWLPVEGEPASAHIRRALLQVHYCFRNIGVTCRNSANPLSPHLPFTHDSCMRGLVAGAARQRNDARPRPCATSSIILINPSRTLLGVPDSGGAAVRRGTFRCWSRVVLQRMQRERSYVRPNVGSHGSLLGFGAAVDL
jgi:hypothetical protein